MTACRRGAATLRRTPRISGAGQLSWVYPERNLPVSRRLFARRRESLGEGAATASGGLASGMRYPSCRDIAASVHSLRTSSNYCEREQPARDGERAAGVSPCS